jgi:hypothetical protein
MCFAGSRAVLRDLSSLPVVSAELRGLSVSHGEGPML